MNEKIKKSLIDHYSGVNRIKMNDAKRLRALKDPLLRPSKSVLLFRGLANVSKSDLLTMIGQDTLPDCGFAPGKKKTRARDSSWTTEPAVATAFACGITGEPKGKKGYSVVIIANEDMIKPILNAERIMKSKIGSFFNEKWDEHLKTTILSEKEVIASQTCVPIFIVWAEQGEARELTMRISTTMEKTLNETLIAAGTYILEGGNEPKFKGDALQVHALSEAMQCSRAFYETLCCEAATLDAIAVHKEEKERAAAKFKKRFGFEWMF